MKEEIMKRKIRKGLKLNKETIRELSKSELNRVVGGIPSHSVNEPCYDSLLCIPRTTLCSSDFICVQ
jgi:natural product precursor